MNLVVTGHVDHGKSTVVGRLLADTGSLPDGKIDAVRAHCARHAKPFEYAFLLDALRDERAQGITIDAARVFFRTSRREYILIDTPGHAEFLRNMVTGAARAEAALLVIDAREGIRDNSRRHGYLLSLLGIRQIAILVNKMDLVGWSEAAFEAIAEEYREFLRQLQVEATCFVPVSGATGDNIVTRAAAADWYRGPTLLETLDGFTSAPRPVEAPFRMPVQGVYKFTANHDERRIVAGTVSTGRINVGDPVVFLPSGKKSRIRTIEAFQTPAKTSAEAGQATGFTLEDHIYVERGEIAVPAEGGQPDVSTRFRASVVWLGRDPMTTAREYLLKLGTTRVPVRVEQVHRVLDGSSLSDREGTDQVQPHEVADCTLVASRPLAFDTADRLGPTSRFVIVDRHQIAGGGIIRSALEDPQTRVRNAVLRREHRWAHSLVAGSRRAERFGQQPTLLLITGPADTDRKALARALEERLFDAGRSVYFLAIANVLYGVDADIERTAETRHEHLRRLGEIANILIDAGLIVVATAVELSDNDVRTLGTSTGDSRVLTAWMGESAPAGITPDALCPPAEPVASGVVRLERLLKERRVIFSPEALCD
jgi:bifunctional enzyme CysN/CysC